MLVIVNTKASAPARIRMSPCRVSRKLQNKASDRLIQLWNVLLQRGVCVDFVEVFEEFTLSANQNQPAADLATGFCPHFGQGHFRDFCQAVEPGFAIEGNGITFAVLRRRFKCCHCLVRCSKDLRRLPYHCLWRRTSNCTSAGSIRCQSANLTT